MMDLSSHVKRLEDLALRDEAGRYGKEYGVSVETVLPIVRRLRAVTPGMCSGCPERGCPDDQGLVPVEGCTRRLAHLVGVDPEQAIAEVQRLLTEKTAS